MKKIVPFIISLLFCVNICAQERMQVRTDNAPLLPFPQLMNNESEYKDIELLKKDWPLYWLRKGTEVTTERRSSRSRQIRIGILRKI